MPEPSLTEFQQFRIAKSAPLTDMQRRVWWLYHYGDAREPRYSWYRIARRMKCRYGVVTHAYFDAAKILTPLFDVEIARLRTLTLPICNPDTERERYEITIYAGADAWPVSDSTVREAIEGRR